MYTTSLSHNNLRTQTKAYIFSWIKDEKSEIQGNEPKAFNAIYSSMSLIFGVLKLTFAIHIWFKYEVNVVR